MVQLVLLALIVALGLLLIAVPDSVEYTMAARGWQLAESWGL